MEGSFKLKGGAIGVLLYRFLKLVIILNIIIALPLLFFIGFKYIPHVEIAIVAVSFLIYASKREAVSVTVEGERLYVHGRTFIVFRFKTSANYKNIRYKFTKSPERAKPLLGIVPERPTLILYKNKKKWVEFTASANGWSRSNLADLVKTLLAKGCYNWFDFNKR
jgi:hypothetical protein